MILGECNFGANIPPGESSRQRIHKCVDFVDSNVTRTVIVKCLHDGLEIFDADVLESPLVCTKAAMIMCKIARSRSVGCFLVREIAQVVPHRHDK